MSPFLLLQPFVDLQYVFLEKNEVSTPVEKPKILDAKRKRIKKRKGNKNLLKKCLSPNAPRRRKNKGAKKASLSSIQESENAVKVDMEPSQPRPIESEKKENLVLSPIDLCANVKRQELVPGQEPPCDKVTEVPCLPQSYQTVDKTSDSLLVPNMDMEIDGNVNENEAPGGNKSTVKIFVDREVPEPLMNSDNTAIDSSFMVTPAVNGLIRVPLDETDNAAKGMDTSVSNYASDKCMNHISAELESSALLHGLLVESS